LLCLFLPFGVTKKAQCTYLRFAVVPFSGASTIMTPAASKANSNAGSFMALIFSADAPLFRSSCFWRSMDAVS
jgi:hypothetical protein